MLSFSFPYLRNRTYWITAFKALDRKSDVALLGVWGLCYCHDVEELFQVMVNGQWFIVSYDSANKQKHHKSHRMCRVFLLV